MKRAVPLFSPPHIHKDEGAKRHKRRGKQEIKCAALPEKEPHLLPRGETGTHDGTHEKRRHSKRAKILHIKGYAALSFYLPEKKKNQPFSKAANFFAFAKENRDIPKTQVMTKRQASSGERIPGPAATRSSASKR